MPVLRGTKHVSSLMAAFTALCSDHLEAGRVGHGLVSQRQPKTGCQDRVLVLSPPSSRSLISLSRDRRGVSRMQLSQQLLTFHEDFGGPR